MHGFWRRWRDRRRLKEPEYAFLFERGEGQDELICVDTETSCLDPARAELLAIGAVPVAGRRILLSRSRRWIIRPSGEIDPESIKVHGLRPRDVQHGMPVEDALREFLHYIGNRTLLGYYLEFDVAMLDKYLRPMLGIGLPNRRIEVSTLYYDRKIGIIPRAPLDLRFNAIREELGVPLMDPHDALGDAVMTAMMYVRLTMPDLGRASGAL